MFSETLPYEQEYIQSCSEPDNNGQVIAIGILRQFVKCSAVLPSRETGNISIAATERKMPDRYQKHPLEERILEFSSRLTLRTPEAVGSAVAAAKVQGRCAKS